MAGMKRGNHPPETLSEGERVWIAMLKDHGTVISMSRDGQRALVEVNRVKMNVPVSGLRPPVPVRAADRDRVAVRPRSAVMGPLRREIDMHGLRVEEMLPRLEQFLNRALLDGCSEVRVIHGHGSGALKRALHKHLREMGFSRYRLGEAGQTSGGDGVTIVSL